MHFINERSYIDLDYVAKYENKIIYLYARSEKAAKQKAIEYFRLNKKQSLNLFVMGLDNGH